MADPLSFPTTTPRFGLPLLFAGQAQKEFAVNAAHAMTDSLLHPAIRGEAQTPPADPADGECWLVSSGGQGAFLDRDGQLATYQAGVWLFAVPRDGMRVFDVSTGQFVTRNGGWKRPAPPASPSGGTTIDSDARSAIDALVAALRESGIFSRS